LPRQTTTPTSATSAGLSYDFRDKYLLTATFRRDGAARFAPGLRYGNFPSVSAAWRIGEEAFMAGLPFVSDLKVRASWGQLGNSNTAAFPYIFKVSFTPDYGSGNTTLQAPSPVNFPNRNISWEIVETTDFGFDVTLFNKISLLATYYRRNTKDFLYNLPIPYLSGFGSTPVNAGSVLNTGVELELGYNTTFANGLGLNVSGNLTTVKKPGLPPWRPASKSLHRASTEPLSATRSATSTATKPTASTRMPARLPKHCRTPLRVGMPTTGPAPAT
jgi:outer membrane receptor protein involved in Fe transport